MEASLINAVVNIKEEQRRERGEEKEEKRKGKAEVAAAAIEEGPKSEPKDGGLYVIPLYILPIV